MDTSDVIAAAALGLSAVTFGWSILRPKWLNREAHLDVRHEQFWVRDRTDWIPRERIVVTNHGPATARDLSVVVRYDDGRECARLALGSNPPMPIPALYPGQTFHLALIGATFHEPEVRTADLTWSDGRRAEQRQVIYLSHHQV